MISKISGELLHFIGDGQTMQREVHTKAVMSQLTGTIQFKRKEGEKVFLFLRSGI